MSHKSALSGGTGDPPEGPVTLTCDVCKKTVVVPRLLNHDQWMAHLRPRILENKKFDEEQKARIQAASPGKERAKVKRQVFKENQERSKLEFAEGSKKRWHLLSAGRFGSDVLACSYKCVEEAREKLTPPEMIAENPHWRIGDYSSWFDPMEGYLPWQLWKGWPRPAPPPKPPKPPEPEVKEIDRCVSCPMFLREGICTHWGSPEFNRINLYTDPPIPEWCPIKKRPLLLKVIR